MHIDKHNWAKQRAVENWKLHEKLVRRALFNLGIRGENINDLVQDTFERFFIELIEKGEPQSCPKWLKTVALNLGRDFFDRASNKNHFPLEEEAETDEENWRSQLAPKLENDLEVLSIPDGSSDKNLSINCVKKKLQEFRVKHPKKFFAISLINDGYQLREIAEILDRTDHATRQFMYECRKALMPYLRECWE